MASESQSEIELFEFLDDYALTTQSELDAALQAENEAERFDSEHREGT